MKHLIILLLLSTLLLTLNVGYAEQPLKEYCDIYEQTDPYNCPERVDYKEMKKRIFNSPAPSLLLYNFDWSHGTYLIYQGWDTYCNYHYSGIDEVDTCLTANIKVLPVYCKWLRVSNKDIKRCPQITNDLKEWIKQHGENENRVYYWDELHGHHIIYPTEKMYCMYEYTAIVEQCMKENL